LPLCAELFILPKYIFSKWLKFVLSNGFDNLSGCHTYLAIRFREYAPITCILILNNSTVTEIYDDKFQISHGY